MRAAVLPGLNETLQIRDDVEVNGPGPGEVRVRIAASGVCHSDLSLQNGTLPHPFPVIPGHEGAGEVLSVGDGVTSVKEGDHVIMAFCAPCGDCPSCLRGQPNLCNVIMTDSLTNPRFVVDGMPHWGYAGNGSFSEEIVVRAEAAIPIPEDVPLDVASLIGCGVMTGVGASLNTAKVTPGSSVAVFGCGGVGLSVIQGARICGAAEIIAVDLLESKRENAKKFGATYAVSPNDLAGLSMQLTGGEGFDYAFEVVGLSSTIRAAWDATRRGGTTCIVGAGKIDDMVMFSAFEIFYMERNLIGSWYGSADVRRDFPRLLRLWREGRLDLEGLISQRIDLSEINEAFEALKNGEVIRSVVQFK
ncbi:MAG: Zn-dependent alcohol dehydrogenase [Actinomycetota bacterium]|nr:Zn-dependent alcohol dehydrogenase [Actinomycetota bacterium]